MEEIPATQQTERSEMSESTTTDTSKVEFPPFVIIRTNGGGHITVYRRSGTAPEWDEFKKFRATDEGQTCGLVLFTSRIDAEKRMKTFAKQTGGKLSVLAYVEAYALLLAQAVNAKK